MNHGNILDDVCIYYGMDKPSSYSSAKTDEDYDKFFLAIEDAEGEVFLERNFKFRERNTTFSTVANTRAYTNSYGQIRTEGLYIPSIQDDPIPYYGGTDLQDFVSDTTTGKPEKWTIRNHQILFYPIPDAAYTVYVEYQTQNYAVNSTGYPTGTEKQYMTAQTDEPNYPDMWHKLVVYKAMLNLLCSQKKNSEYSKFEKKYRDLLAQMARESTGSKEAGLKMTIGKKNPSRLASATYAFWRSGLKG